MTSISGAGRSLVFDIETDGLLDELTRIHCLCIMDVDTGELWSCCDWWHGAETDPFRITVAEGLKILSEASRLIGHNVIRFDIPAIRKVQSDFTYRGEVFDTMLATQVVWPGEQLKNKDGALWNPLQGRVLQPGVARPHRSQTSGAWLGTDRVHRPRQAED